MDVGIVSRRKLMGAINMLEPLGVIRLDEHRFDAPAVLNCSASRTAPLLNILPGGWTEILSVAGEWQMNKAGLTASQMINVVFARSPHEPPTLPGDLPMVLSPTGA
jgi:hypothetical protein